MAKRKSVSPRSVKIFTLPGPRYPLGNFSAELGNIGAHHALQWASLKIGQLFRGSDMSTQEQIALKGSQIRLEREQAEVNKINIQNEQRSRMFEFQIKQKELEIEKRQRLLEAAQVEKNELGIPSISTVIQGALDVPPSIEGITGSGEQSEGYFRWLGSLIYGKILLILGRRGSGKTALAGKFGEFIFATNNTPVFWVGLPIQARALLPNWIKLTDSPDRCPINSFIIIDEAGIQYMSLAFNTDRNKFLRNLLMICRQRHCSLVFAVQSSRDLDNSVIRLADSFIFKEPGMHQPETERVDMRPFAKQAALAFKEIPKEARKETAYVFDDDFRGLITSSVPSFWSEELSHVYAHLDLTDIQQKAETNKQLERTAMNETKLLKSAVLDKEILQLRQEGYGIERIANTLGCSTWTVRKCLDGTK